MACEVPVKNQPMRVNLISVTADTPLAPDHLRTDLIDVTRIKLSDLESLDDSALADCVRRVMDEAVAPGASLAGFQAVL